MKKSPKKRASTSIVCTPEKRTGLFWRMELYVAGKTPKAAFAFANLKNICETHLAGQYLIQVIDLMEKPKLAATDQVLALPMVVRRFPVPVKKIIGDMSNKERVVTGLEIPA